MESPFPEDEEEAVEDVEVPRSTRRARVPLRDAFTEELELELLAESSLNAGLAGASIGGGGGGAGADCAAGLEPPKHMLLSLLLLVEFEQLLDDVASTFGSFKANLVSGLQCVRKEEP